MKNRIPRKKKKYYRKIYESLLKYSINVYTSKQEAKKSITFNELSNRASIFLERKDVAITEILYKPSTQVISSKYAIVTQI